MGARNYDVVFVGGGLAAMLLLNELQPALPARIAIIDPHPLPERPVIHWSYWSRKQTLYDQFAIGTWRRAEVSRMPPEPIAPFSLRLVRSSDVLAHAASLLGEAPVEWLHTAAHSVTRRDDGLYEVGTDAGAVRARWVFDSVPEIPPVFPPPQGPQAVLSGTGIRVRADRPVFDPATATLFDPLDERSFAYLLPTSPTEALLESASFGAVAREEDQGPLLQYIRARYPEAGFIAGHVENGSIPLGFPPRHTSGPRHVLIGAKRGLVKPSAGYGVVRIAEDSKHLAGLWRRGRPLPPSRRVPWRWRFLDTGFLQLAARDPRRPLTLLRHTMRGVPLALSLRFIDEEVSPLQLAAVLRSALPAILRKP
jgi:lycopene beta-cyclase